MQVSFRGIQLLKYPNRSMRDKVKALESKSSNGNGDFWTSVKIDKDKNSSDLLLISGLDLEAAIENMDDNQTVSEYIKENADSYIKRAEVHDYR